jgi:hypothetical protein
MYNLVLMPNTINFSGSKLKRRALIFVRTPVGSHS